MIRARHITLCNVAIFDGPFFNYRLLLSYCCLFVCAGNLYSQEAESEPDNAAISGAISFARQIKPIFQSHCYGCHQPANRLGGYEMTSFESLLGGGESSIAAIKPGAPDDSYLIELITPVDGAAAMPQDADPLSEHDVALIRKWIEQGAKNDAISNNVAFGPENPPTYNRQPNITSIDISPDGKTLAVAGFNEVRLLETESGKLAGRLIGLSSRIETVKFSPDGDRLATAGGQVGQMGEVQVWQLENQSLQFSKQVGYDVVYSLCWSPDGGTIALGGTDSILRAIDSKSGRQILFQSAHEDFIRDIVFSVDGSHLVSVARDTTCKLTEVATERFVDNITSITPLLLKGGIAAVARHPERDEILIGGADGVPKIYRMHRLTKRVIGDDANMVRRFPQMEGRISAISISPNGKMFAVASSIDGKSTLQVYSYDFDSSLPDDVKAIMSKVATSRNQQEKDRREEYVTADIELKSSLSNQACSIQTVRFLPDNETIVYSGSDGIVRLVNAENGETKTEYPAVAELSRRSDNEGEVVQFGQAHVEARPVPAKPELNQQKITELLVVPEQVNLANLTDYAQVVVQARVRTDGGEEELFDVSALVAAEVSSDQVSVQNGLIQAQSAGEYKVSFRLGEISSDLKVSVVASDSETIDFSRDVAPVLTKVGCNAGTCHGSQDGQNGFKLSLRGYDRIFDVRALTGELNSRRVDLSDPDRSLILLKTTGQVPHQGGVLFDLDSKYYSLIRKWIAQGARLDSAANPVVALDVEPKTPVIQLPGQQQSFRVIATFDNGETRDVTEEAVIESSDTEVAGIEAHVVTALRRGEAALMARYEGAYAATTMTVMGERGGFAWSEVQPFNEIDDLVIKKWQHMKLRPSPVTDDASFIRRVYLDLTGLPPTSDEVVEFLADETDTQTKRQQLINKLIGSPEFVDFWTNKWADLLQVNRKYLGVDGAKKFRQWIEERVQQNMAYDQFVREILTAEGSNNENPASSYYKILRTPEDTMENTTHLFLATRFNCNKCHDHPFEKWTQDQYYETAAYFAQFQLKPDPASNGKRIGGTAVEGAKPLYEFVNDAGEGEMKHDRTRQVTSPQFPFDCDHQAVDNGSRRQQFANWLTSADNPYFARSYVNRLWAYMMGVGLIEPIDDIRAGNPPTNPELLDFLTSEFIKSNFDTRHILRLIGESRTYQLSIETNEFNKDDRTNYSHALARRLPAEVILDSVHRVTGSESSFPGVPKGTRAAALSDSGVKLPSGFLDTLGRPARESSCECERSNEVQLGSVLALISGPDVAKAIENKQGGLAQLVEANSDDASLIDEIYLRVLNRHATDAEVATVLDSAVVLDEEHRQLIEQRDARQAVVDERLPGLQEERELAIQQATQDLHEYLTKTDPGLLEREAIREEAIAAAQTKLAAYTNDQEAKLAEWKASQSKEIQWMPIVPSKLESTNNAAFEQLDDRSVLVSKVDGAGQYIIETHTDQVGITAIRLEALADDRLPKRGPGIAENGNFVLTEFQVEIAPRDSDDWQPVPIKSAISDFDQQTYPVKSTLDGNIGGGNGHGWAISPQMGKTHWATYQLALPVGFRTGSRLRIRMHQNYDPTHSIGRFRISLSQFESPVGLSVSEEWLAKMSQELSEADQQSLVALFKRGDPMIQKLNDEFASANTPLDIEPGIVQRRQTLASVSMPIPDDAILVQLNSDVKYSAEQLEQRRLTMAQDLTWALINSPAFLFNH